MQLIIMGQGNNPANIFFQIVGGIIGVIIGYKLGVLVGFKDIGIVMGACIGFVVPSKKFRISLYKLFRKK